MTKQLQVGDKFNYSVAGGLHAKVEVIKANDDTVTVKVLYDPRGVYKEGHTISLYWEEIQKN